MMTKWTGAAILAAILSLAAAGCNHLPGKPGFRPETLRPDQTLKFGILYKQNCSACHGNDGRNSAAMPLNNPVYLAWAGHDRMVPIVASGVSLRSMHAFARTSGGILTDQQGNAKRQHDRPCGGSRHVNRVTGCVAVLSIDIHSLSSTFIIRLAETRFLSSDYIDDEKHDDPHAIDKVPIHRQGMEMVRLLLPDLAEQAQNEDDAQHQ